ncbi:MAG: hypothetical protein CVV42_04155 [Candidatus Riflebacteria bacterium HGW-Riflebacteria-2]|nr:MAG: hypothetical protein CVV42_04155 [Candidatus Riflebacteria bacterium HGW-Riflebacteria-2]
MFRPGKLLAAAGIMACIAIFFLAAWLYRFPERLVQRQSSQKAGGIVSLAAEIAARPAQQIRNSLLLMAKNPELRKISSASNVLAWQQKIQNDLQLLIDSYEPVLGNMYGQILDFSHDIDYYCELPSALARRLATIAGMAFPDNEEDDPTRMLQPVKLSERDFARMLAQTGLVREKIAAARRFVADSCALYLSIALTLEKLAGFGRQSLHDAAAVEDFFSAALNDELLRSVMLRSLDGEVLAIVGDMPAGGINLDTRDCQAIGGGSIFFAGPVGYDSRRRHALWWVAVPVRDTERNPVACLTAFVDIDYLSQAAEKVAENADSRLVFSDSSGQVIGHADREIIARQVNMKLVFPSFVSEADRGFKSRFVRYEGRLLLQAGRSVRYGNVRHLPDWYVRYEQDLTAFATQSQFLVTVSVILLAALGMYALSCCVVRLF